jgi:UDP-glucuronate decarboxylase
MKTILITGSNGFIGNNLIRHLLKKDNYQIIGIDNFISSNKKKNKDIKSSRYSFYEYDITANLSELNLPNINIIFNLACPASPPRYQRYPLKTIKACTDGLFNILELAKKNNAKVFHASTSEVYGDPEIHPQVESYNGNVNTFGPRSCYDEGKRLSETICYEYINKYNLNIFIGRIFNTYGPYMDKSDGRVITNFITQAIKGDPITIYGDGTQTRSFQYIDDLIEIFIKFIEKDLIIKTPLNLGNPEEISINRLANKILKITDSRSKLIYKKLPQDDPSRRNPDISRIQEYLNWKPLIKIDEGLEKTISWYQNQ